MTLFPGTHLGPYEILAPLGTGGMGEVWKAKDTRLDRFVAIKVLPEHLAENVDALARFEREAKAVAALNHPNILALHDLGKQDGVVFAVMELLEGESLRERLGQGPLPPRKAIELAVQLAQGLAAAHEKGVIHRDLKPDNLWITKDGRLKILDFGLAKQMAILDSGSNSLVPTAAVAPVEIHHTKQGMVIGTAGYMSPEQVRGEAVDARSDIFSFGAVLFEMLTGKKAFTRTTAADSMAAILKEDPQDLESIPPGLQRVLSHCLEKDSAHRFQDSHDLAFALENLAASSDSVAWDSGPMPRKGSRRPLKRPYLWLAAGAIVCLGLGVSAGYFWPHAHPGSHATVRFLSYSGHDTSPAASSDGRTIAFCSDRDGKPRIWLKQMKGGSEVAITSGPDDFPRFSPDGSMLLFTRTAGARSDLCKIPVLGGEPMRLAEDAADGDWSPDGKHIVFMRWGREQGHTTSIVLVADADGGNAHEIIRLSRDRLLAHPRWSPDGHTLAISGGAQQSGEPQSILLMDSDGQKARTLAPLQSVGYLSAVAWLGPEDILYSQAESVMGDSAGSSANFIRQNIRSAVANRLLWTPYSCLVLDLAGPGRVVFDARSPRQNLHELPLSAKGEDRWLSKGNGTDRQPVFSPDGDWVAFSSNRSGNLDLWAVSTRNGAVRHLTDDEAEDWDPGFTPDGQHLLWSSNRSGHFEIWMAGADGSGAMQLSHDGADAENPTATPDNTWIVYKSGQPQAPGLWKVHADGSGARRLVSGAIALPEVSPDGRYALYRVSTGPRSFAIHVVQIEDGRVLPFQIEIQVLKVTPATLGRARWMPGGGAIVFTAQDSRGVNGLFSQGFSPDIHVAKAWKPLAGFDPERITESFGISPDGKRVVVAGWEQLYSLMSAEEVPGLGVSKRSRP